MGRDEYSIITCSGCIWGAGAQFRREFDLEGSEESLEYCTLSVCFVGTAF